MPKSCRFIPGLLLTSLALLLLTGLRQVMLQPCLKNDMAHSCQTRCPLPLRCMAGHSLAGRLDG